VSIGCAASDTWLPHRRSEGCRDFFESTFSRVMKNVRRLCVLDPGLYPLDVALDVPIGDENIEPAVEIVVEKETAETERQQAYASDGGSRRLVDEEPIAFVVIERKHLIREVRDHDARITGSVVVCRVRAHSRAGDAFFAERDACENPAFR